MDRDPYDGKPYYCALCHLGFDEFLACEAPDCKLESEAAALKRQANHTKKRRKRAKVDR